MKNKKQNIRKLSYILLSATMVLSFAAGCFTKDSGSKPAGEEVSTGTTAEEPIFEEAKGVDGSALFLENYNPDVVMMNDLTVDSQYTAIVTLEGETLSERAVDRNLTVSEYLDSFAATAETRTMKSEINAVLNRISSQGIEYEVLYTYTTLVKGVALRAYGEDLNKIAKTKGVKNVIISERYAAPKVIEIENDTNVYTTGIYNTSGIDPALRGNGTVIAVLDTGMDVQHPAFQDDNFNATEYKLTYDKVAELFAQGHLRAQEMNAEATVETTYKSKKLPYGFDYADKDSNTYPSYSSHGVHVAGIIAGNHTEVDESVLATDDDLRFEWDENKGTYYFEGVAPDAQIVPMKVFTDNIMDEALGGAQTENILAALEDATALGVDVINMSLGSSAGFSSYVDDFMEKIYTAIENAGISLVCAASNDYSSGFGGVNGTNLTSNPDSATVGSPSTYGAAISVASIEGQKAPYMLANDSTMVFFTEASDGNSNKLDFIQDVFTRLKNSGDMAASAERIELQYVVVPGLGRQFNYTESIRRKLNEKPSIALVSRGTTTFEEKMKIAKENGAVGIMIYNNVAGTINMTMGLKNQADIIPSCSIRMDIGNELVLNAKDSVGTIVLDANTSAGPFMSDFSSWGPTPSLELKPEITAYGGNVTSAVAGGYDVYSGTSMATPNMAGAVAIIRQFLKSTTDLEGTELSARVYQLMMSTANLVLNEEGNPYSPRKQGAGIANIEASLASQSYITVEKDGVESNKTKIQLGDDPKRGGVYEFEFKVHNTSTEAAMYTLGSYVMTETVSSDGKTVAEKPYLLKNADVSMWVDGAKSTSVFVDGGTTATVRVKITLDKGAKEYLDANFKNGMYVEGFITLKQTYGLGEELNDLSIPYLAFYGDWTDAPMLDYSAFEMAENLADDSIPDDEKYELQFFATAPYSKYGDKYILPMGQYLYVQEDDAEEIFASEEKAAISRYREEYHRTSYAFYAVYAGLLRGMAVCEVEIRDEYTGEVVWHETKTNVAKGYAAGGSNRPGFVEVEFNPDELGIPNNSKYRFSMVGYLDYGDGKQGHKNSFSFSFYTDYEAPTLVDADVRYEEYKDENEDVKMRVYLDVTTYDNHFTQSIFPCYINNENYLTLLTNHVVPVYADRVGQTVKTTIEITDFYEDYDVIYLQVEDYAMNYKVYTINLAAVMSLPERVSFDESSITLGVGATARPAFTVYPSTAQNYDLTWISSNENIVRVDNGEIFAVAPGETYVTLQAALNPTAGAPSARLKVIVTEENGATPRYKALKFNNIADKSGAIVNPTNRTVEVHPNEYIQLVTTVEPWYMPAMNVQWTTSDPTIATVEDGLIHTLQEGSCVITARQVLDNGSLGIFTASVYLSVGPEFVITSYMLREYHGVGGFVEVPEELNFMYIDEECFMGNTTITGFVVPEDVMEIYEKAFYGCTALEYISFPKSLSLVRDSAFEGCTSLKTIDLTSALSVIFGNRCFYGCTKLEEVRNDARLTAIWDYTFAGCTSLTSLNISNLVQVGKYSFADCINLKELTISRYTEIGEGMFFGCTGLKELSIPSENIGKNAFYACSGLTTVELSGKAIVGEGAFRGCTSLTNLYFTGNVYQIGDRAFEGCTLLQLLILPNNAVSIGKDAFYRCTALARLGVQENSLLAGGEVFRACANWKTIFRISLTKNAEGKIIPTQLPDGATSNYYVESNTIYNRDKKELILVPQGISSFSVPAGVERIGDGVFYGKATLESITLPEGLISIGAYAFSQTSITSVSLPASLQEIGVGAFSYCFDLKDVTFAAGCRLTVIPEGCFNTDYALTELAIPASVTEIGDYAFGASGLSTLYVIGGDRTSGEFNIDGANVKRIGEGAFSMTEFVTVALPATLESMGGYAFAICPQLAEVTFNSAVNMGDYTFFDSPALTRVEFHPDITSIGEYTFAAMAGNPSLEYVKLPEKITEIGTFAFYGAMALKSLEIPATVKYIGDSAFYYCISLSDIDLSHVEHFGKDCFAETGNLGNLNLAAAKIIDEYAFYMSGADEILVPVLEEVYEGGLAYTDITTITLPASLKVFGSGALHYNFYLETIYLNGKNDKFFIDPMYEDGAGTLYSILPNGGYQAEAYPGGSTVRSYSLVDGTVRVAEMAFTGAINLVQVELPISLKSIGDKGFYDCRATVYIFHSMKAPNLEARYIDGDSYAPQPSNALYKYGLYEIFGRDGDLSDERFYANFYYYAMFSYYNNLNFGLNLYYPSNGIGYDEFIWRVFFSSIYTDTKETVSDDTLATINAIKALPSIEEIQALLTMADKNAAKELAVEYSEQIKAARRMVKDVMGDEQLAFLRGGYDGVNYEEMLVGIEKAMAPVKEAYGILREVVSIRLVQLPNKTSYIEGETIDTTGLIIIAEFDDGLEEQVTDYTLSTTVATVAGARITVYYGGKSTSFRITVTANGGTEHTEHVDADGDGKCDVCGEEMGNGGNGGSNCSGCGSMDIGSTMGGMGLMLLTLAGMIFLVQKLRRRANK